MDKIFLHVRVSSFRNDGLVWGLLVLIVSSFIPSVGMAQPITAIINELQGTVLVNGQVQEQGTNLGPGDLIETQADTTVELVISDGSVIQLGEHTTLDIAVLTQQRSTGVRTSRLKLLYGRIRVLLSQAHQHKDSSFRVETPNAQLGVKFSQPDVEIRYDPRKRETIGLAYTVALIATNLITEETVVVPVGSTVIITSDDLNVLAWLLKDSSTPATTGMGMGTKIAIGVGAAAAIGAGVAVVAGSDDGGTSPPVSFNGTFSSESVFWNGDFKQQVYTLAQEADVVTGTIDIFLDLSNTNGCQTGFTLPFTGTVTDGLLSFSLPFQESCCCSTCCARIGGGDYIGEIGNDGNIFTISGALCGAMYDGCGPYFRQ